METFTILTGVAAPLMRANIDTDTIIRIERLMNTKPAEAGRWLFESLRLNGQGYEDPDFILNQPRYRDAPILISGENFGCGSSREGAVWALKYSGIRCIIAPSFGDIFANNCFQNLVLPIVLPASQVERLAEQCANVDAPVVVNLMRQLVGAPSGEEFTFSIETIRRDILLTGADEIDSTLRRRSEIEAFKRRDQILRPWIWLADRKVCETGGGNGAERS